MTKAEVVDGVEQLRSEILRICSRLLELTDLTVDDDFFDKGGDSLLATELMLELRQLTGKALPDSLLFESSTVRSLAQRLSEKETRSRRWRFGSVQCPMTQCRCCSSMATGREVDSTLSILLGSWDREFHS